ncbi:hypothetical protein INT48_008818 [Thamnidium elegans]|uniref:F-box domain-containing protein n=1 Tax=Thamnidium elegans TaxID=101142 RepID=A0A8H7SL65_9FUNG|nr:hypothetical protein INT48_008818 [Thamnidium elegans]
MSQHNYHNTTTSDYRIPVAPPHILQVEMADDIEMADADTVYSASEPYTILKLPTSKTTSSKPRHTTSDKPVNNYHDIKPAVIWSVPQQSKKGIDFTTLLPAELCSYIISFLDFDSLMTVPKVCRIWASIFYTDELWRIRTAENNWRLKMPDDASTLSEEENSWYYWYKQRYQLETRWKLGQVATHYLVGHVDSVYCLQFDDKKIITGSRDRSIKVWDLQRYQCTHTLNGHQGSVLCLEYNDDMIVSGSSDHTVIVWDMKTKRMKAKLNGHTDGVSDISFDERYIVSSSKDTSIRIWSSHTFQPVLMIVGHLGAVNAIQLRGDFLVSASNDRMIKLWQVSTGTLIREFVGHENGLACVQYDGKRIISGSNDRTIRIWDAETGICTMKLLGHRGLVRNLRSDGDKVVSAGYDRSIRVWDINTGTCLLNFQSGHSSWIFDVHFDKRRIIR